MVNKILEDFLARMVKRKLLFDLPPTERDFDDLVVDLKEVGLIELEIKKCQT
jgi:hypothetical protein